MITGSFSLVGIQDAILVESCYKATQQNIAPSTPTSSQDDQDIPEGWSGTLISVSASMPYVWESQREKDGGIWSAWSTPVLKNSWGKQGAKMRMSIWKDGVECLAGADGEDFYDIKVYGTNLYLCTKRHIAQEGVNDPITSIENYLGYWESAQQWTFIATQLLLAGKIVTDKITADLIDATNLVANGIKAEKADISGKISATEGSIGGFEIGDNRIGIETGPNGGINGAYFYPNMIGFNDGNRQAIVGAFNLLGIPRLAQFIDNNVSKDSKYGIFFDISGGDKNFAFFGNGDGVLNGSIIGYKLWYINSEANNWRLTLNGIKHNILVFTCVHSNAYISLPTSGAIDSLLNISSNVNFASLLSST